MTMIKSVEIDIPLSQLTIASIPTENKRQAQAQDSSATLQQKQQQHPQQPQSESQAQDSSTNLQQQHPHQPQTDSEPQSQDSSPNLHQLLQQHPPQFHLTPHQSSSHLTINITMDVIGLVGVAAGTVSIPLAAVATSTAVVGISQGVSGQQNGGGGGGGGGDADKDDPRLAKFNLYAECSADSEAGPSKHVDGKIVVLRKGRLFLDAADPSYRIYTDGHPFSGFFLEYPVPPKPLSLVSTISRDPPELNWIYADDDTLQVKYGNKTASVAHIHGPWDWTSSDPANSRLVLEEWEGFVALEESPGVWGLYYDQDDDLLEGSGIRGERRVVEVSLRRRLEKKT